MRKFNLKRTAVSIFLLVLFLVITGCGQPVAKKAPLKQVPTDNTVKEELVVQTLDGYEIKASLDKSSASQISIPVELIKNSSAQNFDIKGITLTVNGSLMLKDLIIREGEMTKNWIFQSNYDDKANQLKAAFMNLAPVSEQGNLFYIDIPSSAGEVSNKNLKLDIEVADGTNNYSLPSLDIPLS